MNNIIGIDVGQNGAAVMICENSWIDVFRFKNATETDICNFLQEHSATFRDDIFVYLEQVHSMPKQGVASCFDFGKSYGFITGCLTALQMPFELVTPQKWQKALNCQTKGDKNITKSKAQQLFPNRKWTHADADAVLIAEYGRRKQKGVL